MVLRKNGTSGAELCNSLWNWNNQFEMRSSSGKRGNMTHFSLFLPSNAPLGPLIWLPPLMEVKNKSIWTLSRDHAASLISDKIYTNLKLAFKLTRANARERGDKISPVSHTARPRQHMRSSLSQSPFFSPRQKNFNINTDGFSGVPHYFRWTQLLDLRIPHTERILDFCIRPLINCANAAAKRFSARCPKLL